MRLMSWRGKAPSLFCYCSNHLHALSYPVDAGLMRTILRLPMPPQPRPPLQLPPSQRGSRGCGTSGLLGRCPALNPWLLPCHLWISPDRTEMLRAGEISSRWQQPYSFWITLRMEEKHGDDSEDNKPSEYM